MPAAARHTCLMDLSVRIERWPLASAFTISRGSKTEAVVVTAELADGTHKGRGECVPYARYGETPDGVVAAIAAMHVSGEDNMGPGSAAQPQGLGKPWHHRAGRRCFHRGAGGYEIVLHIHHDHRGPGGV